MNTATKYSITFQISAFHYKWTICLLDLERIVILQVMSHTTSIMLLFNSYLFKDISSNAAEIGLSKIQSVLNYVQSIFCYKLFLLQMILKGERAELWPFTMSVTSNALSLKS